MSLFYFEGLQISTTRFLIYFFVINPTGLYQNMNHVCYFYLVKDTLNKDPFSQLPNYIYMIYTTTKQL